LGLALPLADLSSPASRRLAPMVSELRQCHPLGAVVRSHPQEAVSPALGLASFVGQAS